MDLQEDHQSQDPALLSGDPKAESVSSEQSTSLKQLFSQLHQGTLSLQRVHNLWLLLVCEYSILDLSRPRDRYYAFAGIADIFNRIVKDECLAGIWKNDIARGLCWTGSPCSSPIHSRSLIAPTWSWMSRVHESRGQFGSSTRYHISTDNFMRDERLIISHSAPGSYFSFGLSKDNILDITAVVIPAPISIFSSRSDYYKFHISLQSLTPTIRLDADCPGPSGDDLRHGDECFCLLLGRNFIHDCVVVLRKCRDSEGEFFNRIGITQFDCHEYSQFEDAEVRRLSVI